MDEGKVYTREDGEGVFVRGDKILLSATKDFSPPTQERTFHSFDPSLRDPFIYISNDGFEVYSQRYAKKIRPDLAVDAKVWGKTKLGEWKRLHFSHWDEQGNMRCFDKGMTSHTHDPNGYMGPTSSWDEYSLTDPNKPQDHQCCNGEDSKS